MRAIWTGSIAFGLVNVPVKAYGATEDHDISLHQVHATDGGRIKYERRCEICGKKIKYKDIDKAFDDGERTVVLTEDDMDALPAEKSREIEVVQFIPADQLDPLMLEKSYYLQPDSKSPKAYELLRRTLEDTDKLAVVRFALRQKTRLGVLRVRSKALVLQSIMWADELRDAEFAEPEKTARISAQELKMSATLVESYSGDFSPEDFSDDYQTQLRQLIDAKIEQGEDLDTEATFGTTSEGEGEEGVVDLMEALKRSIAGIEKSSGGKGGTGKSARGSTGAKTTNQSTGASTKERRSATAKKKKTSSSASKKKASPGSEKSA